MTLATTLPTTLPTTLETSVRPGSSTGRGEPGRTVGGGYLMSRRVNG